MENIDIIYQYIRGSKAHGISTPQSDTDMGGLFCAPMYQLTGLGLDYKDEVSDEKHDVVYWELAKFGNLLLKSNPTVLEALFVDPEFVMVKHPVMDIFLHYRDQFLTKECFDPFGRYAEAQIRKARGLNKMINQPILERKTPIDFCYVTYKNDTIPVNDWLKIVGFKESDISLAKMNHARDAYAVFLWPGGFCKPNGNDVHINNLPKGLASIATLFFNKDAYSKHCKDYKNQKEWEAKRNPVRYESNKDKSYDAKNMSECLRLVHTCTEIASGDTYHVNRKGIDGDLLLDIRAHKFEFEQVMDICEEAIEQMHEAIDKSTIRDSVVPEVVNHLILRARSDFYGMRVL